MAESHSLNTQLSSRTSIFGLRLWIVLGVCVGAAIVILLFLISLWFIHRRSNNNKARESHTIVPVVSKEIRVDPIQPDPTPTPETTNHRFSFRLGALVHSKRARGFHRWILRQARDRTRRVRDRVPRRPRG
ncbi:unnamed protein product [Brassica oleracea]